MAPHVDKVPEGPKKENNDKFAQRKPAREASFEAPDNRPAISQLKNIQRLANQSPQIRRSQAIQRLADQNPSRKSVHQLQSSSSEESIQKQEIEAKESIQEQTATGSKSSGSGAPPLPPADQPTKSKVNSTGLPDQLKSGVENLSGQSLDDVKVHYNSPKPQELQAHAYAQGSSIHIAPGQEKHLPHEAWHVAQQKQGRVKPTKQLKNKVAINDDAGLEREADVMGAKAMSSGQAAQRVHQNQALVPHQALTIQRNIVGDLTYQTLYSFFAANSLQGLIGFLDVKALAQLKSYQTFNTIYGSVEKLSNAIALALNIWDSIPAPVRTGILYIVGRVINAIPLIDAMKYTEGYIVDADKDVKSTYLVYALDKVKMVLKAASSPVSASIDAGKYIYSWWWSKGEESTTGKDEGSKKEGEKGETEADRKKDLAKLNLHIIWLNVKGLHLEKTQEASETGEKKEGGLHADFSLGVHIFNRKASIGENGSLTLILPWSGGAILESKETINIINQFTFPGNLFQIHQLDMTHLTVSNEGLQELGFHLNKFSIGADYLSVTDMSAEYHKSTGLSFAGNMAMKIFNWAASAHLIVELNKDGNFTKGVVNNFKESAGVLTIEKAEIDKETGFELINAEAKLPESTGIDLSAKIAKLNAKDNSVSGQGSIEAQNINLLGEKVVMEKASGQVNVTDKSWDVAASAALKMNFDHVKAKGTFKLGYDSEKGLTVLNLEGGQFNVDYDTFSVAATDMTYDHAKREFKIATATMDIKAIKTKGEVKNFRISKDGVDFETAAVTHKDPINPFPGLSISDLLFLVKKNKSSYDISASGDIDVNINSPKVLGKAVGVKLAFSKDGYEATVSEVDLKTNPFDLAIKDAKVSKEGLHVEQAMLSINSGKPKEEEAEMGKMVNNFNTGILDFIPVGPIAFEAKGIDLNKSGLKVKSFRPKVPAVGFDAFGIKGNLDVENLKAKLEAEKKLSLEQIAAGFPLKVEVIFPVLPGLEVYGSLGAHAEMGISVDLNAAGKPDFWEVGGNAKFQGAIGVTAELGAQVGSQVIAALSAGVFAKGEAKLDMGAGISGKTKYDRANKKFKAVEPLIIAYNLNAEAIASIGVVIKAKAFYFFNKTIYEYTAAKWTIGKYELVGKIGSKDGGIDPEKPEKLGLDKKEANPIDTKEIKGTEAEKMLKSDTTIHGSGTARKELLLKEQKPLLTELRKLHNQSQIEQKAIKDIEEKYISTIQKKDALYRQMIQTMSSTEVNEKLLAFNTKYKVKLIQEQYEEHINELAEIQHQINERTTSLDAIDKLDKNHLEKGISSQVEDLDKTKDFVDKTKVPGSSQIVSEVNDLSEAMQKEIEKNKITISKYNGVMSSEDFEKNTTTKEFLRTTTRKTIIPVDNALEAYHANRNEGTLRSLLHEIDTYLSNSKSKRIPYVLLLQHQVKAALGAK